MGTFRRPGASRNGADEYSGGIGAFNERGGRGPKRPETAIGGAIVEPGSGVVSENRAAAERHFVLRKDRLNRGPADRPATARRVEIGRTALRYWKPHECDPEVGNVSGLRHERTGNGSAQGKGR